VRKDLEDEKQYGKIYIEKDNERLYRAGYVVTIKTVFEDGLYDIAEPWNIYFWTGEMFEGPALQGVATAEETIERIKGKLLDYSNAQGAIGEIELLKYINEKLSEYYNGYGVKPPTLNYWADDSVPAPKSNKIIINLSEEKKQEIIKEIADELKKRIGKEWML